jgi:hypothetical protein
MAVADRQAFQERVTVSIRPGAGDDAYNEVLAKLARYLDLCKAVGTHQQWIKLAMFNQYLLETNPANAQFASQGTMAVDTAMLASVEGVESRKPFHERINVTVRPGRATDRTAELISGFIDKLEIYKSTGTLQHWVQQACIKQFMAGESAGGTAVVQQPVAQVYTLPAKEPVSAPEQPRKVDTRPLAGEGSKPTSEVTTVVAEPEQHIELADGITAEADEQLPGDLLDVEDDPVQTPARNVPASVMSLM